MDCIEIKDLIVFAKHGVYMEERRLGQKFVCSAKLYVDTREACETDDVNKSIHYGEVAAQITDFLEAESYNLIETCVGNLANYLLRHYPSLKAISLRLAKPWAPVGLPLEEVAVEIYRKWQPAIIALGSNMGERQAYLNEAVEKLTQHNSIRHIATSTFIETEPVGYTEQDKFLNGAVFLETLLSPQSLLRYMQKIEDEAGRERKIHWGPRTVDLDLIYYADQIINSKSLTVPHPRMQERSFVLQPVVEIAPNYIDPRFNLPVSELLERLKIKQANNDC